MSLSTPLFVGTGPVLIDQFVHCHDLPEADDLPEPGTKLQAVDADHMQRVRRQWVEGWQVQTQVGGPVYVALRQARRLGARTDFVGAIGSDELGEMIVAQLADQNFNTDHLIRQDGHRSGSAIVWIDRNGERSILFDSGSLEPLAPASVEALMANEPTVIHVDSREPLAAKHLATRAREHDTQVHYDIDPWNEHSEELLRLSNCAQVSARELGDRVVDKEPVVAARHLQSEFDLDLSIVTLGENGVAAVARDGSVFKIPGYASSAVDSTGAGDAFSGAFEYFRVTGSSADAALRAGCAAGAFISAQLGNTLLAGHQGIGDIVNG